MALTPYRCMKVGCKLTEKTQYLDPLSTPVCESCGNDVTKLAIIHHITPQEDGVIQTAKLHTTRIVPHGFACKPANNAAKNPDKAKHPRHYSGEVEVCTCYECLLASGYTLGDDGVMIPPQPKAEDIAVN